MLSIFSLELFTQKEIIKIFVQIAVKNLDFDFAAYSVKVIIVKEKKEDRDKKRIYASVRHNPM